MNNSTYDEDFANNGSAFHFASFICACLLIIVAVFGIIGNILSFFVFTISSVSSSINILLSGQAIIDIVLLCIATPLFATMPIYMYYPSPTTFAAMNTLVVYTYPLSMMAQTATVLTTVVITCERYLAVCRPLKAIIICTTKNAKRSLVVVVIFSIVYNVCRFLEFSLAPNYVLIENLRQDLWYMQIYYHWLYFLIIFLIPFVLLASLNGLIVKKICSRNRRGRLQRNHRIEREYQTSLMMVVITFSFLACNTLAFLLKALENVCFRFRGSSTFCDEAYYAFMIDLNNLLVEINSSIPFLIYASFSRCFRLRLMVMMKKFRSLFISLRKLPTDNFETTSYYHALFNGESYGTMTKISLSKKKKKNSESFFK